MCPGINEIIPKGLGREWKQHQREIHSCTKTIRIAFAELTWSTYFLVLWNRNARDSQLKKRNRKIFIHFKIGSLKTDPPLWFLGDHMVVIVPTVYNTPWICTSPDFLPFDVHYCVTANDCKWYACLWKKRIDFLSLDEFMKMSCRLVTRLKSPCN